MTVGSEEASRHLFAIMNSDCMMGGTTWMSAQPLRAEMQGRQTLFL
jgi:hypothetical protein